jgi:hypothetical protein
MATRPTRPKGYLSKGKTKSPDAARKAAARQQLTSPRALAGLVLNSVLSGTPAGRGAKAASAAVSGGKKVLSGKALDAAINRANLSARSTKPVRNAKGGLKTTTGQGRKKVSFVAARKLAEKAKFAPAGIQRGGKAKGGMRPLTVETGGSKGQGAAQLAARPGKTSTKDLRVKRTDPKPLKAAAKARKNAPAQNREAAKTPEKKYAAKKPQRLTRIEQKRIDRLVAKSAKSNPEYKRSRNSKKNVEPKPEAKYLDKTKVIQTDSMGRVIGSTTKGKLSQLKVKTENAAENPRLEPFIRGVRKQRTIDERSPRPRELTAREEKIARIVGKRDYNDPLAARQGRTANILANKVNQREADRRVNVTLRDPRLRAQDVVKNKADIKKFLESKSPARKPLKRTKRKGSE